MNKNKKIVGITPAMPSGSSLKYMMEEIPDRTFDVGIAEQHAVTSMGSLAKEGFKPFCTIYSTFLQRGFEQKFHKYFSFLFFSMYFLVMDWFKLFCQFSKVIFFIDYPNM